MFVDEDKSIIVIDYKSKCIILLTEFQCEF